MRRFTLGRLLGLALVLLAAGGLVLRLFGDSGAGASEGSVESLDEHGRRLLALLVAELGLPTRTWSELPQELVAELPDEAALLWSAAVPDASLRPSSSEREERREGERDEPAADARASAEEERASSAPEPSASAPPPAAREPDVLLELERRRAAGYRAFVERGGTWILPAGEASERYLAERLGLPEHARAARTLELSREEREARTLLAPDGLACALEPAPARALADARPLPGARPLLVDDAGRSYALALPLGRGELVLLADDAFLDNGDALVREPATRGLAAKDGALVATRLIEAVRKGGPLVFDEFALGLWRPASAWSFAWSPSLRLASVQLALLLVLGLLALAWPRAFPRDPRGLHALSPLERARARAGLLLRARRPDLLALELRRGALDALARGLGSRSARARGADEALGAEALDAREVERVLARLAPREPALAREWGAWLLGAAPSDEAGLAQLGARLRELERRSAVLDARAPKQGRERAPGPLVARASSGSLARGREGEA